MGLPFCKCSDLNKQATRVLFWNTIDIELTPSEISHLTTWRRALLSLMLVAADNKPAPVSL